MGDKRTVVQAIALTFMALAASAVFPPYNTTGPGRDGLYFISEAPPDAKVDWARLGLQSAAIIAVGATVATFAAVPPASRG